MNLFNRKTLKRHITPAPILTDHLATLDAWGDMIRSGRVYALKPRSTVNRTGFAGG